MINKTKESYKYRYLDNDTQQLEKKITVRETELQIQTITEEYTYSIGGCLLEKNTTEENVWKTIEKERKS